MSAASLPRPSASWMPTPSAMPSPSAVNTRGVKASAAVLQQLEHRKQRREHGERG